MSNKPEHRTIDEPKASPTDMKDGYTVGSSTLHCQVPQLHEPGMAHLNSEYGNDVIKCHPQNEAEAML